MMQISLLNEKRLARIMPVLTVSFGLVTWVIDIVVSRLYRDQQNMTGIVTHIDMIITIIAMLSVGFLAQYFILRSIKSRQEIKKLNLLSTSILDTLPTAVYVFDQHDHCVMANKRAADDIGKEPGDLIGKHAHGITNIRAIATEGEHFITNEFGLVDHEGFNAGRVLIFFPDKIEDTGALDHKNMPRLKRTEADLWHKEKGEIREELCRLASELGRTPAAEDLSIGSAHHLSNINFHYSSFNAALIDAGLLEQGSDAQPTQNWLKQWLNKK